jgi:ADP-ribose pyrophosphatase
MIGDWTIIEQHLLFTVRPYVSVTRERVRTDSGVEIDDFYRVEMANFSICIPQLVSGEIVTIWQYKHGPRKWGLTFPAGYIDAGETAEKACRRELLEETGHLPGELQLLGEFVDNGNQRGSLGSYFVARDCRWETEPKPGDLETMEIRLMSVADVHAAISAGQSGIIHHVAAWGLARDHLHWGV